MKKIGFIVVLLHLLVNSFSQSIGIGTSTPIASAALDITSSSKGLLPPRVALTGITDLTTIVAPATGLIVYNTATAGAPPANVFPGYYYFNGTNWQSLVKPGNASGDIQYWNGTQWALLPAGNSGQTLSICNGVPTWGPCPAATAVLPVVATSSTTNINSVSATVGGNVSFDGGSTVTSKGICYSRNSNPSLADSVVLNPSGGAGSFSLPLTNLAATSTYHIRAFAINSIGTAYGGDSSFTTLALTSPTVTTSNAFGIGASSANSGGVVTSSGGALLISRGIVYSTSPGPTLANSTVNDGNLSLGTFTSLMTGLLPDTTYYVRAFANNAFAPVAYGNEISFTTLTSGFFAASYTFDSVKTTSGLIDPSPLPTVTGIGFGPFSAVGAGAPTFYPNAAFRFTFQGWTLGATNGSDVFTSAEDSSTKYYEVTVTPAPGRSINLNSMTFRLQRSGTGVRQCFKVQC